MLQETQLLLDVTLRWDKWTLGEMNKYAMTWMCFVVMMQRLPKMNSTHWFKTLLMMIMKQILFDNSAKSYYLLNSLKFTVPKKKNTISWKVCCSYGNIGPSSVGHK